MDEQVASVAARLAAFQLANEADRTPTPQPRAAAVLPAPWPQNRSPLTPWGAERSAQPLQSAPPPSTVRRRAKSAWNVFQEGHKHLKWTRAEMADAWAQYKALQGRGMLEPSLDEYRPRAQQNDFAAKLALLSVERPRRESVSDEQADAVLAPLRWSEWTCVGNDTVASLRSALGSQHGVYEWAYGCINDDKENAAAVPLTCFYVGRGGGGGAADGLRARFNKYVRDGDAFYSDRAAGSGGAKYAFWRRVQLEEGRGVYFRYCVTPPDAAKRAEEAMLAAFDYKLNSEGNGQRRVK